MPYVGKTPSIGNFQVCDAISVVNGQAAYTMQVGGVNVSPESANHMLVSLNGILQAPTSSFTVSGSTITFASNLVTGDVIDFIQILGNVLDLGVPSDNTVSLAKLTATGTKDATTFLRGDNTFAAAGGGKVLQVLTATTTSQTTTTSTSFQSTNIAVSITPSLTTSKIFIIFTTTFETNSSGNRATYGIFRDSTQLTVNAVQQPSVSGSPYHTGSANFLDSPNTTSAISYNVKFKSDGNIVGVNFPSGNGTITCFEIGV